MSAINLLEFLDKAQKRAEGTTIDGIRAAIVSWEQSR